MWMEVEVEARILVGGELMHKGKGKKRRESGLGFGGSFESCKTLWSFCCPFQVQVRGKPERPSEIHNCPGNYPAGVISDPSRRN